MTTTKAVWEVTKDGKAQYKGLSEFEAIDTFHRLKGTVVVLRDGKLWRRKPENLQPVK